MKNINENPPGILVCFSHLRWDFVFQRPQHLLTRCAQHSKVYYIEEPIFDAEDQAYVRFSKRLDNLWVCVPHLPFGINKKHIDAYLANFLDKFLQQSDMDDFTFWYYTPMALSFSDKYRPKLTVYDCMDELSAFKFAPAEIKILEKKLLAKADIVFTGGHSLYEAKKNQHANIYPFPSSIEKSHFEKARLADIEPQDQQKISGKKIGFYGVIDERFDIDLIRTIAEAKPDWQIILIGPVVKIDQNILPRNKNIHYLGQRGYEDLPKYLSGWDMALIPFLLNESTRFISPTKTPEYLSAGIPVVSTPIRDVVKPYGMKKLVHIASTGKEFIEAIEKEFQTTDKSAWLEKVDKFLEHNSWDDTYEDMRDLLKTTMNGKAKISIAS